MERSIRVKNWVVILSALAVVSICALSAFGYISIWRGAGLLAAIAAVFAVLDVQTVTPNCEPDEWDMERD